MSDEEKRIYVVVAAKVYGSTEVLQPPGRQVAQACHAVSLMRVMMALRMPLPRMSRGPRKGQVDTSPATEPITTIVLQARDSNELSHIRFLLTAEDIPFEVFSDTNEEYGRGPAGELREVYTALATYPVEKVDVVGILDYLPLWAK